jgi:hypothetical protein
MQEPRAPKKAEPRHQVGLAYLCQWLDGPAAALPGRVLRGHAARSESREWQV